MRRRFCFGQASRVLCVHDWSFCPYEKKELSSRELRRETTTRGGGARRWCADDVGDMASDDAKYVSALPSRSTRGKRLDALLADEGDDEFYGQEFFASESDDDEYESEEEVEDIVDDDFHDEESSESEGEVHVARERTGKSLKAPERVRDATGGDAGPSGGAAVGGRKASGRTRVPTGYGADAFGAAAAAEAGPSGTTAADGAIETFEARRTKRATAQMILEQSERMRAERAAKPAPERTKVEHREYTQEELLEEAKETEYWNLLDLQRLLTLEAELKKKVPTDKPKYVGPSIVYRSSAKVNGGVGVVELRRGAETPAPLKQAPPKPHAGHACVITGQPAKYKDPLTGQPYATIEAFKEIRRRYEESRPHEEEAMDVAEEKPTAAEIPRQPEVTDVVAERKVTKTKNFERKRAGVPPASTFSVVPLKIPKDEPMMEAEA